EHAAAGLDTKFPEIETWANQFPGYEIVIDDPEFTSVCPKTGLPDFRPDHHPLRAPEIVPRIEVPEGVPAKLPELGDFPGKHREPGARGCGEVDEACVGGGERGLPAARRDFDGGDREVAEKR